MSESTLTASQTTSQQNTIANVLAGFFAVMGIGAIIVLVAGVLTNQTLQRAESANVWIIEFLDVYGIIIPALVIGLGLLFVNFSRKLFARDIIISGWAQLVLFWSTVGATLIIFIHIFQVFTTNIGADADEQIDFNIALILAFLVSAAVTGAAWWWLTGNRHQLYTSGEETIASRQSLTAWNLLIPTVVILILVAARPLEKTFIGSLTDRTFAGGAGQEVNFVGFQNYIDLLAFRIDSVDCVRDDSGACTTRTVENEIESIETISVDLDAIPELEPGTLDVGIDFFQTDTINLLLEENENFAAALASLAQAAIEEESGESVGSVEVLSVVEGNLVEVSVDDGEPVRVAITDRLTDFEGVDLSGQDFNYAEDVSLTGLNTYRIRSRTLREQLSAIAETEFDIEADDTVDDVSIAGFEDMGTLDIEVTRIEVADEVVYESLRDVGGEAYSGFSAVSTFNVFGNRYILSARDAAFFTAIGNTLFFTFFTVIAELILGMIIALTVNSSFPGRGLMRAAMLIPWAIPTVVSAKLWEYMLLDNRAGVFNDILVRIGVADSSIAWLANSDTQIWALIFVDVWKTTPFMALLILAGLQTIPSDIYEAADVDGANKVRQFFSMTLPLLRPTIAVALVFRTLDAVRAFDVFDVLVGRQLQSMATYNQFVLVETQDFGYASAIGVTMFIIILIFTIIYVRALGVDAE